MRNALWIAASLLALTACEGREAQDGEDGMGTRTAGADAADASEQSAVGAQDFVQTVAMSDLYEIAAAKAALERAEAPAVREFAQMMVTDHTKSSQALKDAIAASGQTFAVPDTLDTAQQAQVDILRNLNDAAFDREYLRQQAAAHRQTLSQLKAFGGGGEVPELRQFAQSTIPTVQMHLDWLNNNATSDGAKGPTTGSEELKTPVN